MFHSYVIELLSKYITFDYGVFIPISNDTKVIKIDHELRVIVKNKVASSIILPLLEHFVQKLV